MRLLISTFVFGSACLGAGAALMAQGYGYGNAPGAPACFFLQRAFAVAPARYDAAPVGLWLCPGQPATRLGRFGRRTGLSKCWQRHRTRSFACPG